MNERWLPVPGHPEYEVSDMGRFRSAVTGRISQARPSKTRGTVMVTFSRGQRELLHRVVLRAFVGEPPEGFEGSHLNGDSTDNRLSNLAWEDHTTNIRRKFDHGTITRGRDVHCAKLTEDDVRTIRQMSADGLSGPAIAERYGVAQSGVYRIIHRQAWKHVA